MQRGREVRVDLNVSDHSAVGAAMFAAGVLGPPIPRTGQPVCIAPRTDMYDWWTESLARHDALRLRLGHR